MNQHAMQLAKCCLPVIVVLLIGPNTADGQVVRNRQRPGLGNEIEGAVWQYTATRKGREGDERLEGKIRVSGTALFDVLMRKLAAARETRIGDIVNSEKDEKQLVFNASDKIKGRAFIRKDTKQKNDLWVGYFEDSDKHRWKFELRKIED